MRLSVVSAIYSKPERLKIFLEYFTKQNVPTSIFEIILIDDFSPEKNEIKNVVDEFSSKLNITFLRNLKNIGQCLTRNKGISLAKGDVISIIDADCAPSNNFVECHIKAHSKSDVPSVVFGNYNIEQSDRNLSDLFKNKTLLLQEAKLQSKNPNSYFLNFVTRNVSIPRSLAVNEFFDEDFSYSINSKSGYGWEDVSAGCRLHKLGVPFIYEKECATIHLSHRAIVDTFQSLKSLKNFVRLLNKHIDLFFLPETLEWTENTYNRIRSWIVDSTQNMQLHVLGGDPKIYRKDISIILFYKKINVKYLPLTIESISMFSENIPIYCVSEDGTLLPKYAEIFLYKQNIIKQDINKLQNIFGKKVIINSGQLFNSNLENKINNLSLEGFSYKENVNDCLGKDTSFYWISQPIVSVEQEIIKRDVYKSTLNRRLTHRIKEPLRVLTHFWHLTHQYELWKMPFKVTAVVDKRCPDQREWSVNSRPIPKNLHKIIQLEDGFNEKDFDLAILHFDETCLNPKFVSNGILPDVWGLLFREMLPRITRIPVILVCHGTPPFKGMYNCDYNQSDMMEEWIEEKNKVTKFVGSNLIICNSYQAQKEWGFKRSKVIWHGLDPLDYTARCSYQKGVIYNANSIRHRPWYRGYYVFKDVCKKVDDCHYLGRDDKKEFKTIKYDVPPKDEFKDVNLYAQKYFESYLNKIAEFSVFLNTSIRSPMPRNRTDAMLLGNATVSLRNHDVDLFIKQGLNGFYGESADELADYCSFLLKNKNIAKIIGMRGREDAQKIFNIRRYHQDWMDTLSDILG